MTAIAKARSSPSSSSSDGADVDRELTRQLFEAGLPPRPQLGLGVGSRREQRRTVGFDQQRGALDGAPGEVQKVALGAVRVAIPAEISGP
jgi:hypothetical protein